MFVLFFQWGVGENGTDFGTLYAMADEDYQILNQCKPHGSKDVGFSIVETEQEKRTKKLFKIQSICSQVWK